MLLEQHRHDLAYQPFLTPPELVLKQRKHRCAKLGPCGRTPCPPPGRGACGGPLPWGVTPRAPHSSGLRVLQPPGALTLGRKAQEGDSNSPPEGKEALNVLVGQTLEL